MKAVRIHNYGDSSVLQYEDAPMPEYGPDEVLIRVHAAGVNPVDWKIREGERKDRMPLQFPFILGWDVAGVIEKKGALVACFELGDQVIARPADTMRNGCYAEYVAVPVSDLAMAPKSISLKSAAGIPLAAQTAWMGLFDNAHLKSGQSVLILGGSGGVGIFAIQLAKAAGAHVLAVSSSRNIDLIKDLGADEAIAYDNGDYTKNIKNIDVVFDTVGGEAQLQVANVVRKGGILISTTMINDKIARSADIKVKNFMLQSNGARLQQIAGLVDNNLIKVVVDKFFPLAEAGAAQDLSQSHRVVGKIILEVN